jgi:hypothetical protein
MEEGERWEESPLSKGKCGGQENSALEFTMTSEFQVSIVLE